MSASSRKRIKLTVFIRDNYECYICSAKLVVGKENVKDGLRLATVDHLLPRSKGGTNAQKNLKACCYQCNQRKGTKRLSDQVLKQLRSNK